MLKIQQAFKLDTPFELILWSVLFTKSDKLITCGNNNSLFQISDNQIFPVTEHGGKTIRNIAHHPSQGIAYCSFDSTITFKNAILTGHENEVKSIAFNPAGTLLASAGRDKTVWIWDLEDDCECIAVLQHHTQDVKCVKFSRDGCLLASSSYDDHINIYREDEDEEWMLDQRFSAGDATIWSIDFSLDNSILASCCDDGELSIWSTSTWSLLHRIHLEAPLVCTSWSRDWLIVCGGEYVYAMTVEDGKLKEKHRQVGHGGRDVNCVATSSFEDCVFASCGDDAQVVVWKIE